MGKPLFARIFGLGKVPKKYRSQLETEGVVLIEESIAGSVTFKKFRAPGRYYGYKKKLFFGALIITNKTFGAFELFTPLVMVPLEREYISKLDCRLIKNNTLEIEYDASQFNKDWSGTVICRYHTKSAGLFLSHIQARL